MSGTGSVGESEQVDEEVPMENQPSLNIRFTFAPAFTVVGNGR